MEFNRVIDTMLKGYMEAWNQKNTDSIRSFLDEEVVLESAFIKNMYPLHSGFIYGRNEVIEAWNKIFELLPQIRFEIDHTTHNHKDIVLDCSLCFPDGRTTSGTIYITVNEYGKVIHIKNDSFTTLE